MNMELHLRLSEQDVERASRLSGITDPAAVVQHALREYVRLRSAAELIRLGGSGDGCSPEEACLPPVRRPPDFLNRPRDLEPPG